MTDSVEIAVAGCGYWGPNLARNFQAIPGFNLRMLCDTNGSRLDYFRSMYPHAELRMDVEKALRSPLLNAVAIATPVHTHYPLARAALLAGKHVFIEKPMASSVKQCEELVRIAANEGLILMVGHTFLYSPAIRKIKDLVDSGTVGRLLYLSARRLNLGLFQKDINVVWDLAPHDLSIIQFITGEMPVAVNCLGGCNVTRGIEDVFNLTLRFEDGEVAMLHGSWLDPKKVRDMTIVGCHKMIHYDDLEPLQKIRIYDQRVEVPPHYDTFAEFQYSYHYGDMQAPYIRQEEPLKVECQHFLNCIRTGKAPLTDGRHGLDIIRLLDAASRSLRRNGARVDVLPPARPSPRTSHAKRPGRRATRRKS